MCKIKNINNDNKNLLDNNKNVISDNKDVVTDNKDVVTDNKDVVTDNKDVVIDNKDVVIDNKDVISDNKDVVIDNKDVVTDNKNYITHKNKINIKKSNIVEDDELFEDNYISTTKIKSTKSIIINSNSSNLLSPKSTRSTKSINLSSTKDNTKDNINEISNHSQDNKILYNKIKDKNVFFNELLKKQIIGIPIEKKLNYNDIKRISKFIKSSIFDTKKCSIWDGYVTNENNNTKGIYINFYFNKKKIALHRLLYINYIGILSDNEYLKFSCKNKGKCCNIYHMKKYVYNNSNINNNLNVSNTNLNKSSYNELPESIQINVNKEKLIVEI